MDYERDYSMNNNSLLDQIKPNTENIIRTLIGEPTAKHQSGREWRFGDNGGLSIDLIEGVFQDFVTGESGGLLALIEAKSGQSAIDWLIQRGYIEDTRGNKPTAINFDALLATMKPLPNNDSEKDSLLCLDNTARTQKNERYFYVDADGQPLIKIERFYIGDKRIFKQYRFDQLLGDWVEGLTDENNNKVERTLYRLPQLIASTDTIHIAEGEKSCDRLHSLGLTSTTSGGSTSWRDEFDSYFVGRDVVLWKDNDSAGEKYAQSVIKSLLGVVKSLKAINLADHVKNAPEGFDVADFVDNGGTLEQLTEIMNKATFLDFLEVTDAPATKSRMTMTKVGDLIHSQPQNNWLVKNFLMRDSLNVIFAQPAAGKSVLMLDLAASVALGRSWNGNKVESGSVHYVAGEGNNGIIKRLKAWATHTGESLDHAELYVSNCASHLDSAEGLLEVCNAIDSTGKPSDLIIIDTLARSFSGDENSTKDMNRFVQSLDALRLRYSNSTIVVIHHSGHGSHDRVRGSTVLPSAGDAVFGLTVGDDGIRKLSCTKMKDAKKPDDMFFELVEVGLHYFDDEGEPVTSVVFETTQKGINDDKAAKGKRFTAIQQLGIYTAALCSSGNGIINAKAWRERFYDGCDSGDSADKKRQAFNRVQEMMVKHHMIEQLPTGGYMLTVEKSTKDIVGIVASARIIAANDPVHELKVKTD
jgi:hypothetical protein